MLKDEDPPELRKALEWLVRLNDDRAPPDLERRFQAWLAASARNRAAWDEANALWAGMEPVKAEFDTLRRRDRAISRRRLIGGLAGLAFAGAGGWHVSRPWFRADHVTDAGEVRDIALADGSLVNLGSRSALSVDLGPERRLVRLLRGEGFFAVAPDPRPFAVRALGGEVAALGTRFNVCLQGGRVDVAVAEHAVSLKLPGLPAVELGQGWQSSYGRDYIAPPVQAEPDSIGAWRQGRMIFRNTPLGEVLAEIARWRGGSISAWGSGVAAVPVTAIFDTNAPDAALETIVQTLDLRMVNLPGGITLIRGG
ncbi:FecR domain-containing protein [Paracoccus sp. pheM1]|uniref:FecR family protein n=1 Tax=Paracoccus sp. pheM1 TaxID=2831675 RepID=UPI001BDB7CD0|nr:FecR domain-containing protein [Paracoccus sp. pheM1]MBT0782362.1 FecR domain-containing protein [Paracoccus sp. pheM1]